MKCKYVKVCMHYLSILASSEGFLVLRENFLGLKDVDFLTLFLKK